jgi:hypothetical protein
MTAPTPTDADVERVARAIMVASNAFGEMWIDPVAIARAAIAAMPAPDAVVGELADAESAYRRAYEQHGGGAIQTGRAWDAMRRAGDRVRAIRARGSEAFSAKANLEKLLNEECKLPTDEQRKLLAIAGWRVVPIEPTDEMLAAASSEVDRGNPYNEDVAANIWHAMLVFAPAPASEDK